MQASSDFPTLDLKLDGCCCISNILSRDEVATWQSAIDAATLHPNTGVLMSEEVVYGIRNLLQLFPKVIELLRSPAIRLFCASALGDSFGLVRGLYFDKPPAKNWTLPWHRDRSIAVARIPTHLGEFRNPTRKAGIDHLTAPASLLRKMLTLRFSLDPMTSSNGPLVFIPGSHHITDQMRDEDLGEVSSLELSSQGVSQMVSLRCNAGDVFAMRPLLAHSSLASHDGNQRRRRVIHLELSSEAKPSPNIDWYQYLPV